MIFLFALSLARVSCYITHTTHPPISCDNINSNSHPTVPLVWKALSKAPKALDVLQVRALMSTTLPGSSGAFVVLRKLLLVLHTHPYVHTTLPTVYIHRVTCTTGAVAYVCPCFPYNSVLARNLSRIHAQWYGWKQRKQAGAYYVCASSLSLSRALWKRRVTVKTVALPPIFSLPGVVG